ncbi:MAG: hypothetical protein ACI8S6_005024 [Myxococcota bacterium]|jgi:hypothetical protein
MPRTLADFHKLSRKNIGAAGSAQRRSFFYARIGTETLLYFGSASEKKLDRDTVIKRLTAAKIELKKPLKDASKWMSGTVQKQTDGKKSLIFTRRKGPAKAEPTVEVHLKKALKDMTMGSIVVVLRSAPEESEEPTRDRAPVKGFESITGSTDSSSPSLHAPTPGSTPDQPGGSSHHSSTAHVVGKILGELAPEIISTGASMVSSGQEARGDSSLVEKGSSAVMTGGSTTELVAHGIALGEHAKKAGRAHETLSSSPPEHDPSDGTPKEHVDKLRGAHRGTEKLVHTLDKVSHIAGEVAVVGGVVYSGAKMVRAGSELLGATERKEVLRDRIRHMKVVDSLQKRFAGQEDVDIRQDPLVRSLMVKFKAEMRTSDEPAPVGKQDVISTLRLFVEIQTSSQKQSGVDLVASALKLAGGVSTLSGVGASVGMGLALTGAGMQLGKAGADAAVDVGRERKQQEERALMETMEQAELSDTAREKMTALAETETAIVAEKQRLKKLQAKLLAKKLTLEKMQESLDKDGELDLLVDGVLAEMGDFDTELTDDLGEDDGIEIDLDELGEILSELDDGRSDEALDALLDQLDDEQLDLSPDEIEALLDGDSEEDDELDVDDVLDGMEDEIALSVLQDDFEGMKAALKASQEQLTSLRQDHAALESDINDTVLPELFQARQKQRLEEILSGKERREKVTDGHEIGLMERVRHETSVNEDASRTAMEERRELAVDVLLNGKIPPFLRQEMLGMLGIDEESWALLQAAEVPERREALRLLMVV